MQVRVRMEFEGIVQGVGFRPFLHQQADALGLTGWVLNSSAGVLLELEGETEHIDEYVRRVCEEGPPLSRVLTVRRRDLPTLGFSGFTIKPSLTDPNELTLLCPDVALCPDCLRELRNPVDRRYHYPFINCTNCGPRYTIVESLPYDRPATTMRGFPLCDACRAEYTDVSDRRYHAQPVACPACGPQMAFELLDGNAAESSGATADRAIEQAVRWLRTGRIVGIKGLGGFHLACLAADDDAVLTLRRRKLRSFFKPLAIMAGSLEAIRRIAEVDEDAERWLTGPVVPVVLLSLRPGAVGAHVSRYIAPRLDRIGVMLPYTPLHRIILDRLGAPLVMTSGNLADEPIVHTNEDARSSLVSLADALLTHDRPIHARCDDSVLAATSAGCTVFRHSRGLSPFPIALAQDGPDVLALGGDIKTTFAASRGRFAFLSPHLGDAEHSATYAFFRETWEHYRRLFNLKPQAVGCDLHPGYHIARWAQELAAEMRVPLVGVQHHHAHLASLLAERGLSGPEVAIVADGTGYGLDGTIWGGEIICGDAAKFERLAHLRPMQLPGGDAAATDPWRIALALLHDAAPEQVDAYCARLLSGELAAQTDAELGPRVAERENPSYRMPTPDEVQLVRGMIERSFATVASSSLGRLLDGLAALLGITMQSTYEGQAPMELEAAARRSVSSDPHHQRPVETENAGCIEIDWRPLVAAIAREPGHVAGWASAIHTWIAHAFASYALPAVAARRGKRLLATGGCLQNTLLQELLANACSRCGVELVLHREIPANDGGLALGVLHAIRAGDAIR